MAGRGRIDDDIAKLIKDLKNLPKEMKRQLRKDIRKAAMPALRKAKSKASFSRRIPGATRIATRFTSRNPGVRLETNARRAPHAKPLENQGREGHFRHPLFGDRRHWVIQNARPYLWPAVKETQGQIVADIDKAVLKAARKAGFR
ncbi:MAG: hypothetical protein ACRDT2_02000 [Natronosporangium sp.]